MSKLEFDSTENITGWLKAYKLPKERINTIMNESSDNHIRFSEHEFVPCKGCKRLIYWGQKFGKKHPFNPDNTSHFDTCPHADIFRSNPRTPKADPPEQQPAPIEPTQEINFDVDNWLRRRLGLAQKRGTPYRPGTYTETELQLKTDLLYDYCSATGQSESKAKPKLKKIWAAQTVLKRDHEGYFLKGEPRVDLIHGLPVYRDITLQAEQEERYKHEKEKTKKY